MTDRLETKVLSRLLPLGAALIFSSVLAACAATAPHLAQGARGDVTQTAPRMTQIDMSAGPLDTSAAFAPWASMEQRNREEAPLLEACIADKSACATGDLIRFRRMLELARDLPAHDQLNLVHHYFNTVRWVGDARDIWSTLYHTASQGIGDCEDIAIAKYQTLLRLGWDPKRLRVLIGWDNEEHDWHAWLAAREDDGSVSVLDSIKGLQRTADYRHARIVYSVSDQGVWDHAPDYVPLGGDEKTRMASERAARIAANERLQHQGVLK